MSASGELARASTRELPHAHEAPARARRFHRASGAPDDEALARRVGAGDETALAHLYERYHQPLYRYCRTLLRDDEDARDAMQETFTKALRALREARRAAPVRPWLFRIAHNEAMTTLRKRSRTRTATAIPLADPGDAPELDTLVADLARLSPRQRSALIMREFSGLSHVEIGVALEMSANAAKQAIFEARTALFEFAEGRRMACAGVIAVIDSGDGRRLQSKVIRAHLEACTPCDSRRRARVDRP